MDLVKNEIIEASRRLYQRNCLAATDGNISVRIDDEIYITPSGKAKAFLRPDEMAILKLDGTILKGQPSGERHMHLAIYRKCPSAHSVVHAHPPHAIAWSVAEPKISELPNDILSEVILAAGRIPIVPYGRPTTPQLPEQILPFLPQHRLMILERHGGVAWGESLEEAVNAMERLEHSAQILWLARTMGPLSRIPESELIELRKLRDQVGERIL